MEMRENIKNGFEKKILGRDASKLFRNCAYEATSNREGEGGRGSFWSLARVRPSDSRMGEGVQRGSMILKSPFSRIIRYDGEERIYISKDQLAFSFPR